MVTWLLDLVGLTLSPGLMTFIVHLIIAALVLMFAGNFVKGLVVNGFGGAIIAALAIGLVAWVLSGVVTWLVGLIS